MKLKEIIDDISWLAVKESLIKEYEVLDADLASYEDVLLRLKSMELTKSDMRICIDWVDESKLSSKFDEKYWHVGGKNGTLNKESEDFKYFKDNVTDEFANAEQSYAIEFSPWSEWLAMEIDNDTANNIRLTKADIIAHCLYEMTFVGYEEEKIQGVFTELKRRSDSVKNMTEEELKNNTVSIEELKKHLKEKFGENNEE